MNTNLRSKDFRRMGLDALRGNWPTAVLTGFIASLLGAAVIQSSSGSSFKFEEYYSETEISNFFDGIFGDAFLALAVIFSIVCIAYAIFVIIVSGAARLGYASYNLNLVDGKPAKFEDLFSKMNRKWNGFCMNFFMGLYIALWSLLLVVPGIIKTFAYAMTPYILAEHPEMTANEAIGESIALMDGHKWSLFKLYWSFIGWGILVALPPCIVVLPVFLSGASLGKFVIAILAAIPLSAGSLFLRPYMEAAHAAFYRSIAPAKSEGEPIIEEKLPII